MSRRIKFHTFHILFRLFAFLADKSGGWRVFVRPKLLLGSLMIGLGLTIPKAVQAQNQNPSNKSPIDVTDQKKFDGVLCYDIKETNNSDTTKIYNVIEQMPQFPGGDEAMMDFIIKNVIYPERAIKEKVEGRVIIHFVITKTGQIDHIEVIRSLTPDCDKEAVKVIKLLPGFIPGKHNGSKVSVWYTIPVTFKLKNNHVPKN